jgi:hypothetical protein
LVLVLFLLDQAAIPASGQVAASKQGLPGPASKTAQSEPMPLDFAQRSFPDAMIGVLFRSSVQAIGGSGLYDLTVTGDVPPGLIVETGPDTVAVGGVPTATGIYQFEISIDDAVGGSTLGRDFTIHVFAQAPGATALVSAKVADTEAFTFTDAEDVFFPAVVMDNENFTFTDEEFGLDAALAADNEKFTFTDTETLNVQTVPSITWATPADITYPAALSATQLDATSAVAGTFAYSPTAGTVLTAGVQTLSVTFTPTDTTKYATATATVELTVNQAIPAISWPAPAAIPYGTALSATQLDASATVAGTFAYSPAAGTVLTAGTHTLSATFNPADATDYTAPSATVSLTVNQATPVITWSTPAAITYGTALSATQLNASATGVGGSVLDGTFVYTPPAATVLSAGTHTLSATFTPADAADYTAATATVSLTVNQAVPTIIWPAPAPIPYGTPLGSAQLDAVASIPGTYAYTPPAGTELPAGLQTLSVTFTPTDNIDYAPTTQTVTITITPAATGLVISPASLSLTFNPQLVGTFSVAQYISLTNTGTAAVAVGPAAVSGPFAISNQAGTCTTSMNLAAGRTCVIRVVFSPTAGGPAGGSLVIDSAGAPGGSYTVSLSGTGQGETAALTLSTTSVTFPTPQALGTSSGARYVQIDSTGTASLVVTGVTLTGADSGDFLVSNQAGTCTTGATLAYNEKCNLRIVFVPTAAGTRTATLFIADNAAGSPQQVLLSGTGQGPAPLTVTPASLALTFAATPVGSETVAQYITLKNAGASAVIVAGAVLGGSNPRDFLLSNQAGTCTTGQTLAPGALCNLRVNFKPTATGSRTATVTITDNSTAGQYVVDLTGTGE